MLSEVLPWLTGPAGALVVMAGVLIGIYRIVDTRIIPAAERFVDRHLQQVDKIVSSHDEDRKVWADGLQALKADVDTMKLDVHAIREDVDAALGRKGAA